MQPSSTDERSREERSREVPPSGGSRGSERTELRFPMSRHRLPGSGFQRAYSQGRRARGACFTVVVHPNQGEHRRLGLSVGKRCWKGAVQRNRVRRVFREAFRLTQSELPPGVDVVLVASTPRLVPKLETCRSELRSLTWKAWRRYQEVHGGTSEPPRPGAGS